MAMTLTASTLLACNLSAVLQPQPTPAPTHPTLPIVILETPIVASATPPTALGATITPRETATWSPTRAAYGTPGTNPAAPLEQQCNSAYFVGYVGSADGAVVGVAETFKKTWDVRNVGTCTWTRDYRLAFFGGEHMSGPNWVPFPQDVPPGDHMFIGVTMIAPYEGGTHTSYWMLQAPDGTQFGVGERGDKPLRGSIFVP
jgi:hypothetical protein